MNQARNDAVVAPAVSDHGPPPDPRRDQNGASTRTSPTIDPAEHIDALLASQDPGERAIVNVDAASVQLVVFAIGETRFAFPGRQITEVLPLAPIYPVPGCPSAVEGVMDVRGEIVSVLRLGDLLAIPHAAASRRAVILHGRTAAMESGLRVDAVHDVLDQLEEAIQPAPGQLPERLQGLVTGLFQHQGQPVLVLDLARLFETWLAERS